MKEVCAVCGATAHDLRPHFLGGRKESCCVTLEEYKNKYPDRRVVSQTFEIALAKIRHSSQREDGSDSLTPKAYDIEKTFGIKAKPGQTVMGFLERSSSVPEIDPEYIFPQEATSLILLGLETNRPTMVHGPTGSGKTTLVEQIAARINYPAFKVNHHSDMYTFDILGQKIVRNGATVFEYGPLPTAMKQPMIYIQDEWDALNPEIALQYQPVLERRNNGAKLGSVILTANDSEKVDSHKFFRIVATSNTCGLGDEKGHYQGTQIQNLAFVSRFLLRVKHEYFKNGEEEKILSKKFPSITKTEKKSLVSVAQKIRDLYEAGKIGVPFSLR
ncbi:MAG: AAA family ATPase, partial [Candidatus Aminicenantes bacterium]|nr:AAA family ATPase [Candidatus Aminicenantes bacterium]